MVEKARDEQRARREREAVLRQLPRGALKVSRQALFLVGGPFLFPTHPPIQLLSHFQARSCTQSC